MNVCSSALSEAALQVLFLASQPNTAPHLPLLLSAISLPLSLLSSLKISHPILCVRILATAFAHSSCCVQRADISVNQKHALSFVPRCSTSLLSSSLLMSE